MGKEEIPSSSLPPYHLQQVEDMPDGHESRRAGPTTWLACSDMGSVEMSTPLPHAIYCRQERWLPGHHSKRVALAPHLL